MSPTIKHVDFEIPNWGEFSQGPQTWTSGTAYADAVTAIDGLLLYLRMNEATGINANNLQYPTTGHGTYHPNSAGTWNGGSLNQSALTDDDVANAALFNGTSAYLRTDYTLPNTGSWTINLWARNDGQTTGGSSLRPLCACPMASGAVGDSNASSGIYANEDDSNAGYIHFQIGSSSTSATDENFSDGLTHMITLVKDGSTARPYYDGQALASFSIGSLAMALPIDIGGAPTQDVSGSRYFHGLIAETAIWSNALNASQINNLYVAGNNS